MRWYRNACIASVPLIVSTCCFLVVMSTSIVGAREAQTCLRSEASWTLEAFFTSKWLYEATLCCKESRAPADLSRQVLVQPFSSSDPSQQSVRSARVRAMVGFRKGDQHQGTSCNMTHRRHRRRQTMQKGIEVHVLCFDTRNDHLHMRMNLNDKVEHLESEESRRSKI